MEKRLAPVPTSVGSMLSDDGVSGGQVAIESVSSLLVEVPADASAHLEGSGKSGSDEGSSTQLSESAATRTVKDETERFIRALRRSHLLNSAQFKQVALCRRPDLDARKLARKLVIRNWITAWQARQLLAGHSRFFLGKYKLLESLGRGGMGTVFRAEQPGLKRVVALKVMSNALLNDKAAVSRFQREMLAVGALNHPRFVVAHDADSVGDSHFLVMECIDGRNLKDWITSDGPLPLDWSCDVIRQTADGLQHAFERGLIHRDIKPSNLLIEGERFDERPNVKILDMGLARFARKSAIEEELSQRNIGQALPHGSGDITVAGQIMGSPIYIAPEQAQNSAAADIRADIYGLGVTLFEMLTGKPPIHHENIMETIRAKLQHDPPSVRSLRADLPIEIDSILQKMLARDPQQRFQLPGEVAEALAPFAASRRKSVPLRSPADGPQKSDRHHDTAVADNTLAEFIDELDGAKLPETTVTGVVQSRRSASRRYWKWGAGGVGLVAVLVLMVWGLMAGLDGESSADASEKSDPNQPQSAAASSLDHQVARWCLQLGGRVLVESSGELVELTDADLLPNSELSVVDLNLEGASVVDTQLFQQIGQLKRLRSLNLRGTVVSDPQVALLSASDSIERLNLALCQHLNDKAGPPLARMKQLKELDLSFTSLGDAGVESFGGLRNLRVLNLSLTNVSDLSLKSFEELSSLHILELRDTSVSELGKEQLRHELPGCLVR